VAEWCQDAYDDSYNGAPVNGDPLEGGPNADRAVRGGSWKNEPTDIRSAARFDFPPDSTTSDGSIGFRVARTDIVIPGIPLLTSLSPSTTKKNLVLAGQDVLVNGAHFSAVNAENTVLLNAGSGDVAVSTFGADATGARVRFQVPVAILPPDSGFPVSVQVRVVSNGVESSNSLVLTITLDGGTPPSITVVAVPPGEFDMGDPWNEGDSDERPVHPVTFARQYVVGKYEITNSELADALNWALANRAFLPSAERITGASGAPYNGGPVYANNLLLFDVGDSAGWCQITYADGIFSSRVREDISMADHPAVMVTWWGAISFCNWQSRREGVPPVYDLSALAPSEGAALTGEPDSFSDEAYARLSANMTTANGYRLPTESEWERAAAFDPFYIHPLAGHHFRYGFGSDTVSFSRANYYDATIYLFNNPQAIGTYPYTSSVGFFNGVNIGVHSDTVNSKSFYGCYDMSGNVYEWCQDWLHDSYADAPADGSAWETPSGTVRVVRGGAWYLDSRHLRTAYRNGSGPSNRWYYIGFRVARTVTPAQPARARYWRAYE
jgi:formylglycine-generating enzyme required for sulfatase activity